MKELDDIMDDVVEDIVEDTAPEQTDVEASPETVSEEAVGEQPSESELELAHLTAELEKYKDQLLRTRAEFDNYRKRVLREGEQARTNAAQGIVRDLLPVSDNLERALLHADDSPGAFADGVRMVLRQFMEVLAARGLAAIPALGVPFDPNVHEALSYMPSEEYALGMVMNEFERGYCLGSAVLRPSRVVVSSGPAEAATSGESVDSTETDAEEKRS